MKTEKQIKEKISLLQDLVELTWNQENWIEHNKTMARLIQLKWVLEKDEK